MDDNNLETVRRDALNAVDKSEKNFKWLIVLTCLAEGILLIALILHVDWADKTHLVIFIATLLVYCVLGIGLVALGVFVRVNTLKVIKAIEVTSK